MKDALKQYLALRSSLLKEKNELEERLSEINQVLSSTGGTATTARSGGKRRGRPPGAGKRRGRPPGATKVGRPKGSGRRNSVSLREAVIAATKSRPLSKEEIMDSIKKQGYKFTGKNPMNSLNVVLYSKNQFKRDGKKFSPM